MLSSWVQLQEEAGSCGVKDTLTRGLWLAGRLETQRTTPQRSFQPALRGSSWDPSLEMG